MATDKETLLKRIGDKRGFRFGLHDFLAETDPQHLERFNEWVEYLYLSQKHLDRKTKELIILGVCCAVKDDPRHIGIHIKAAVQNGATKEEIREVMYLQSLWAGALGMVSGLEAWRQAFAPQAPPVVEPVDIT
ncbi:MAG: carboxymuconolactone decarboxylase family protein [Dehalococcoidia bacterium]|nr:carboxymuconolactone decarboxylase family protein [Dehalococcoidia bacterium]